jgi:hypothetical protein
VSKAIKLDVRLFDKDIGLFDKRYGNTLKFYFLGKNFTIPNKKITRKNILIFIK